MTPEEWQKVRPILESALELDPESRPAFVNSAFADPSLRREVESLIAVHEQAGTNALRPGSLAELKLDEEAQFRLPPGKRIGAYEILEEIAVGGMGAVYSAIRADGQYKQQVALKIVRSELGAESTATRFRNERQILASLDHPNIARILDGGTTADGLPYFVMELIDGLPITEYCDQNRLTIDGRLKVFRTVCSAVHYAHQHLVIHRDIKPTNILVTSEGVPKLLDFGIAKILDPTLIPENAAATLAGLWIMTPEYASPEQLRGEAITTATDVYSLGLVLYELLAGHRAHRLTTHLPHEIARAVLDTDPEKPSTAIQRKVETAEHGKESVPLTPELVSSLRADSPEKLVKRLAGDLDNIVLKAIRKEVRDRYSSADQLSEDIRRHLEHLPVLARKGTLAYRCRKYVLRHKMGVAAAALVFVSLVTGIALTIREARIARANELRAERRFNDVRKLSNSLIFEIHDSIQGLPGATPARKVLLERAREYLDSLASESSGDLTLQRDLAVAYERIGLLQGSTLDANTGESEAGISSLQKAVSVEDAVAKANPGNSDDQLNAARGHSALSSLLASSGRTGAREELEKAIAITSHLLGTGGPDSKVLIEQGIEYDHLAFFQDDAGDVQGSAESLQKELATDEALLKSAPQDKKRMNRVAIARVRLGNELVMLCRRKEALEYNDAGLDIYKTLTRDLTNAKARREMAVTLVFRGNIQMMDGESQEALTSFQQSSAMLQDLEKADPQNVLYQLDVAGATAAIARARAGTGQPARTLAMLDGAISVLQQNYARNRSYTDIPYWIGQDHIWRGEILARIGNARGALDEYRKGTAGLEGLMSGSVGTSTRCDLAEGYAKVGAASAAIGNRADAQAAYRRALAIAEPLISSKPANVLALYAAADAYFGMGELSKSVAQQYASTSQEEGNKHWHEACDWYGKSVDAWRQIPNPGLTTPSGFATGNPQTVARNLRRCVGFE